MAGREEEQTKTMYNMKSYCEAQLVLIQLNRQGLFPN